MGGHAQRHGHRPQTDVRLALRRRPPREVAEVTGHPRLDIDQRYYAAAPGIARICDRVIYTHIMLMGLIDKGLLTVDPEVLSEAVVVTTTSATRLCKCACRTWGCRFPMT